MKIAQKFVPFATAKKEIRALAKHNYLKNPDGAVKCIPNQEGTDLLDVIEVLYNDEYINVTVTKEDLRNIHWDAYVQSSDDEVFLPYNEESYEGDLLEDEYDFY